jgi:hypothetical protein
VLEFLLGVAMGVAVLGGVAVAGYFVLRRLFERAAHRVADDIGDALAELSNRAAATRFGQRTASATKAARRFTRLEAYAAAGGMSDETARREFTESIERIARNMDSAVRLPIVGPVGLDAALGLFPVAGDAASAAVSVLLIARSLRYGVPNEIIARMLGNVLVDVMLGAVPVVGDMADMLFRANERNVSLLKAYLASEVRETIAVTPPAAS